MHLRAVQGALPLALGKQGPLGHVLWVADFAGLLLLSGDMREAVRGSLYPQLAVLYS